jgi:hypothetical protein
MKSISISVNNEAKKERKAYGISVGKAKETVRLEDLGVDGRILNKP